MITDHTKSTADVKAAAQQSGLTPPPPKLDAEQTRMVSQLRQVTGEARDRLYITQQKTAHQKALALHQGYARTGTAAALKAVAAKTAPVVQHHIEMLSGM
jgi:putative membrane protein